MFKMFQQLRKMHWFSPSNKSRRGPRARKFKSHIVGNIWTMQIDVKSVCGDTKIQIPKIPV